jgi:uncharacterized membrane protein (DUF2068 family)
MKSSNQMFLRLIAVFKLVKASLLIAVAVGIFKLLHRDVADVVEHWVEVLKLDPNNHFIDAVLEKASDISPDKIKELGLGSLFYAGLFLTEGTGLWFEKRWAEWLTVIITSSLVPIEIYSIHRHPTWIKIAALSINLAIVAYLVYRIRKE